MIKETENLLNVDQLDCERLTLKMFSLIDSDNNRKITKKEMQNYTQMVARIATPDKKWD